MATILARSVSIEAAPQSVQLHLARASDAMSVAGFVGAWDDLGREAAEPNPFYECWFLAPALERLDQKSHMSLLTLWEGEAYHSLLLGLMPVTDGELYGRWPIPHFGNWLHHNAFLGTPLVRKGAENLFWHSLLTHLDQKPEKSLFLHLNTIMIGGPLQKALSAICEREGRRQELVHHQQRAFLRGPGEAEAYYAAAVRGKKRKELRRQKNRLSEMGDLQFKRHDGGAELNLWIEEFLQLERAGWKGQNGSALDCDAETRGLFASALKGAAKLGKLELLDLRLDGKPLAMLVNFLCAPGCFSFKTAFDEEFSRYSPGVLLQIENLALLEREDIIWCDSCAAQDHPMIDSLWTDRREIGRYSIAIGGPMRRKIFSLLVNAEQKKSRFNRPMQETPDPEVKSNSTA